jgi:hypothetical protein
MTHDEKIRVIKVISQTMGNSFKIHFGMTCALGRVIWDHPAPSAGFGVSTKVDGVSLAVSCRDESECVAIEPILSKLAALAYQAIVG